MGSENLAYANPRSSADQENPSEYVRLEADLIARPDSDESTVRPLHKKTTILIYCRSHQLLMEISNELKSTLEPDVEVLITTEKEIALRLLKSGDIDLLLHGPGSLDLMNIYGKLDQLSTAAIGSSLIMIHNQNPDLEQWMNHSTHCEQLTKAITRLNGYTT